MKNAVQWLYFHTASNVHSLIHYIIHIFGTFSQPETLEVQIKSSDKDPLTAVFSNTLKSVNQFYKQDS